MGMEMIGTSVDLDALKWCGCACSVPERYPKGAQRQHSVRTTEKFSDKCPAAGSLCKAPSVQMFSILRFALCKRFCMALAVSNILCGTT